MNFGAPEYNGWKDLWRSRPSPVINSCHEFRVGSVGRLLRYPTHMGIRLGLPHLISCAQSGANHSVGVGAGVQALVHYLSRRMHHWDHRHSKSQQRSRFDKTLLGVVWVTIDWMERRLMKPFSAPVRRWSVSFLSIVLVTLGGRSRARKPTTKTLPTRRCGGRQRTVRREVDTLGSDHGLPL